MRRNREFIERLGDLPADLQTKHDRHLPVAVTRRDPRMSQGSMAPGGRMLAPGEAPMIVRIRIVPWSFVTIAGSKQFISGKDNRSYLLAQNNSGADLWMNFSSSAGVGIGIKLASGWSAEWYAVIPINALHFFAVAAGGQFTVLEG